MSVVSLIRPARAGAATSRVDTAVAPADWRSPTRGLWVGESADGRYLGMVERIDGRFVTSDWAGRRRGDYDVLADAQLELELVDDADGSRDSLLRRGTTVLAATAAVTAAALAALAALNLPR